MKRVLYMGDDFLTGAAAYLGGVMTHHKIPFDYVPSAQELTRAQVGNPYGLFILSDYPSKNICTEVWGEIRIAVSKGAGLLMVGGLESFHGLKGEYVCSPAGEMLPVTCKRSDDRHNYCHGLIPVKTRPHPVTAGLPWNKPAVVCGYNEIIPKDGADVLLALRALKPSPSAVKIDRKNIPLLVASTYGRGKTAAFATDFAPHWVGGLVDWGKKRIKAQARNGGEIEVGEYYVKFIGQLVRWLIG
jgi:uncharacterized membrane protein